MLLALLATPAHARVAARPAPAVDPRADRELRRMSDYLSRLPSFRVQTNAVDEVVTRDGQKIQQLSDSRITLKRPNRLRSERRGPLADVVFRYDGHQFSLFGRNNNLYAVAPAPPQLDEAIDAFRERYGIEAPGADLLSDNVYGVLMDGVVRGDYVGLEPVDGVLCHHLAYRAKDVDWQLWVQDGPQPLPRRYAITTKTVPGQPQFTVQLARWEPGAAVSDDEFVFEPPPGARRIDILPPSTKVAP
jgi:hypothetical protein